MIYHVLPGDALAEKFRGTGLDGEIIVFRDALISGPVDFDNADDFWDARARFVLSEYAEDEIRFHENVADEIERLSDAGDGDEVNLWFEYELFCSVNMWFCLKRLAGSRAELYRVEPAMLDESDRWAGFGRAGAAELAECFRLRQQFNRRDVELGSELWDAFMKRDGERLRSLATRGSERFPYLAEVCAAAAEMDTRPLEILSEVSAGGDGDFTETFAEFTARAGVYGFGDLQVEAMMRRY